MFVNSSVSVFLSFESFQLAVSRFDQMKVEKVGANKYSFDFVGDGSGETIVIDGTDQHGGAGTTLSVAEQGPDNWYVVRKKDGRILCVTGQRCSGN